MAMSTSSLSQSFRMATDVLERTIHPIRYFLQVSIEEYLYRQRKQRFSIIPFKDRVHKKQSLEEDGSSVEDFLEQIVVQQLREEEWSILRRVGMAFPPSVTPIMRTKGMFVGDGADHQQHRFLTVFTILLIAVMYAVINTTRRRQKKEKGINVGDDEIEGEYDSSLDWVPRAISIKSIDTPILLSSSSLSEDGRPQLVRVSSTDDSNHPSSQASSFHTKTSFKEARRTRRATGKDQDEDSSSLSNDSVNSELSQEDRASLPTFWDEEEEKTLVSRYDQFHSRALVRRMPRTLVKKGQCSNEDDERLVTKSRDITTAKSFQRPSRDRSNSFDTIDTNVDVDVNASPRHLVPAMSSTRTLSARRSLAFSRQITSPYDNSLTRRSSEMPLGNSRSSNLGVTMRNVASLLEQLMDSEDEYDGGCHLKNSDNDSTDDDLDIFEVVDGEQMVTTVRTRRKSSHLSRRLFLEAPAVPPDGGIIILPSDTNSAEILERRLSTRSSWRRSVQFENGDLIGTSPGTLVPADVPSAIVVIHESGRRVVSFSGSLASSSLLAIASAKRRSSRRLSIKQPQCQLQQLQLEGGGESTSSADAVTPRISSVAIEETAQRLQRWREKSINRNSISRRKKSCASIEESTAQAMTSLEQHLESCVARRRSLKEALDESVTNLDEADQFLFGEIFYSTPHQLMPFQRDYDELSSSSPQSWSSRKRASHSSQRKLSVLENQEINKEAGANSRGLFFEFGEDSSSHFDDVDESLREEDLLPTRTLLLEAAGYSNDGRHGRENERRDLILALPFFNSSTRSLDVNSHHRSSMVSVNTTTETFGMSYSLLGPEEMDDIAEEDHDQAVIDNIDLLESVEKKCVDPSHRRKLKNARLVVRVVLGPHRKDYKTSVACFEAIDIVSAFRRDLQLVVQELSKGEQIWSDVIAAWPMIWQTEDDDSGMAFPSMPDDKYVDAYEYSVLLLRQIYQILHPSSPPDIEPNIYPVLGIIPEAGLNDDDTLHLGTVGGGVATVSLPLKCLDSNRKKRTRLTPYRYDKNYPLSLQDALRVVRSILGPSLKRVSGKDCLRCLQAYGLLKIKYKELAQQLEEQRALVKDLHQELARLHGDLRILSRKPNGKELLYKLRSMISQDDMHTEQVPQDPTLVAVASQVDRISDLLLEA